MPIVITNILNTLETTKNVQDPSEFAFDVKFGLSLPEKKISSKYLYDNLGSQLYQEIMGLEEYYPARCEYDVLENHKGRILEIMNDPKFNIIDLGAGDGTKTMILLQEALKMKREFTYIPIDISQDSNETLAEILKQKLPEVDATILTGEFSSGIKYINSRRAARNLIMFLGGTMGNFSKPEMQQFLMKLHESMKPGDLLFVGFDLKKEYKIIERAYYDSKGVTARFELNLLTRINNELGGNFNLDEFFYHSYFDSTEGCIKGLLVSKSDQQVRIEKTGMTFNFKAFEHIQVEVSHKFSLADIKDLATKCNFEIVENLYDGMKYYVDSIWRK